MATQHHALQAHITAGTPLYTQLPIATSTWVDSLTLQSQLPSSPLVYRTCLKAPLHSCPLPTHPVTRKPSPPAFIAHSHYHSILSSHSNAQPHPPGEEPDTQARCLCPPKDWEKLERTKGRETRKEAEETLSLKH